MSEPLLGGKARLVDTQWTVVQELFRAALAAKEVLAGHIHQRIDEQRVVIGGSTAEDALGSNLKQSQLFKLFQDSVL